MAKPGATRRASFPGTSTTNCKIHNRLKTKVERRYRIYHPPLNRERNYIRIGTFHHDLKPVPLFTIATRKAFTNRPLSSLSSRSLLFSRILDRLPFRANRPLINQLINSGTSGYKYNPLSIYYREIDLHKTLFNVALSNIAIHLPSKRWVDKPQTTSMHE